MHLHSSTVLADLSLCIYSFYCAGEESVTKKHFPLTWWGSAEAACWSFFFWWSLTWWTGPLLVRGPGFSPASEFGVLLDLLYSCFFFYLTSSSRPLSISVSPLPSLSGLRSLLPPCGFHWGTLTPSTSSCPNKCHVTFPRGKVRWYHNTELVTILYACNSVFSFI